MGMFLGMLKQKTPRKGRICLTIGGRGVRLYTAQSTTIQTYISHLNQYVNEIYSVNYIHLLS